MNIDHDRARDSECQNSCRKNQPRIETVECALSHRPNATLCAWKEKIAAVPGLEITSLQTSRAASDRSEREGGILLLARSLGHLMRRASSVT